MQNKDKALNLFDYKVNKSRIGLLSKFEGMKRLKKEFEDLSQNLIASLRITVGLIDENDIFKWRACLCGPKDTPYVGGIFFLHLIFPDDYPLHSPEIVFLTPIYHLNVNPWKMELNGAEPLGHVSVSLINWWEPETTPREILARLHSIFYWANPDSCFGLERANEYRFNRSLYELKTRYFTKKYANYTQKKELYDKTWDFSCNVKDLNSLSSPTIERKIIKSFNNDDNNKTLNFKLNDNGRRIKNCHCNINDSINEILRMYISGDKWGSLCIYNNEKLDNTSSLKDNGIRENGEIVVIYDVVYA